MDPVLTNLESGINNPPLESHPNVIDHEAVCAKALTLGPRSSYRSEGGSGDSNLSNNETSVPPGDAGSDQNDVFGKKTVCLDCVRLAAAVIQFFAMNKDFRKSRVFDCCKQTIEQSVSLVQQIRHPMVMRSDPEFHLDLETGSELDDEDTSCPDCLRLATSVVQFYESKKDLGSQGCKSCMHVVDQCIALLQLTGNLVMLAYHAKWKGNGARWSEIRKEHLHKMDVQISSMQVKEFSNMAFQGKLKLPDNDNRGGLSGR